MTLRGWISLVSKASARRGGGRGRCMYSSCTSAASARFSNQAYSQPVALWDYKCLDGMLSESRMRRCLSAAVKRNSLRVVLDGLDNPSNIAAILRTLECFGVQYVDVFAKGKMADKWLLLQGSAGNDVEGMKIKPSRKGKNNLSISEQMEEGEYREGADVFGVSKGCSSYLFVEIHRDGNVADRLEYLKREKNCLVVATDLSVDANLEEVCQPFRFAKKSEQLDLEEFAPSALPGLEFAVDDSMNSAERSLLNYINESKHLVKNSNRDGKDSTALALFQERVEKYNETIMNTPRVMELDDSRVVQDVVLVFGNERMGISEEARRAADVRGHLPMLGITESLNVNAAVSACLYMASRMFSWADGRLSLHEQATLFNNLMFNRKVPSRLPHTVDSVSF